MMLKNSTSRITSLRTSYCLGLSFILALGFVSMLFTQQAYAAATATVAWNPDTAQVAGYDVYYGTSSGNYTSTLNAGSNTSATLQNLSAQTYYVALTAYNSANEQSGYSPELVIDSLTASAGAGGTISPSGTLFQSQGASQTFTITPSAGYTTASVLVDGTSVGAVASYTFSSIAANHTISATFTATTPGTYTITPTAGSNGSISPSGAVSVSSGGSQTFTFTPATGYQVSSVTVDGKAVTTASSYTFSSVTANHTISVTFTPLTYTLTPSAGSNGTISPSGAVTVNSGGSQTFTFTPATGYKVSSVMVDGKAVTTASSYSFSNVTANHTISVSFAPATTFTLTASAGSNGTISPSGAVTVNSGGSQTFTITPATGYQAASVLIDGASAGALSSYTFSSVTANHTISATFTSAAAFTITPTAGANGAISPAAPVKVNSGASQIFYNRPGHRLPGIQCAGRWSLGWRTHQLYVFRCHRQPYDLCELCGRKPTARC